ncbi:MAG: hypothetical protein AB9866_11725 [Syntrophobacteraceae bacterium]
MIDLNGVVGSIIDLRNLGEPARGQHLINEAQRAPATAADAGQLFGITIDDSNAPNIFITATSAFGLHLSPGTKEWMPGMWGPEGGPGTIYRLQPETGYRPEFFADVILNGRQNTGPALGNIAYDRRHRQLFVSDLETGMIHRISADDGKDLGHYDHGTQGRASFVDAWSGKALSLAPVAFDPATASRVNSCSEGPFEKLPECWNYADFRRRIWGLAVRHDDQRDETRLFYSVWGSDAFGNPDWADAGEDRRNAVWSIKIKKDGSFDTTAVSREFILPSFFTTDPANGALAGNSRPVSDIEFPDCGPQRVMLLAERGSARNLGLGKVEPFAYPHESRVLTYELGSDGIWRPAGRYDVSFYERQEHGLPRLRAGGAGGCDFGYGYLDEGTMDSSRPNDFVWMTGDNLCSPRGACFNPETRAFDDTSWVDGIQGTPKDLKKEIMPKAALAPPSSGPATPPEGPSASYMIDSDINVDQSGKLIDAGIDQNEATLIGDIDIYERCIGVEVKRQYHEYTPPAFAVPEAAPPPVHLRDMTHMRNASPMHNINRSWHERSWSWHDRDQSWHYRNRSWHDRSRSWHWRNSSYHWRDQSWHWKEGSWHFRSQSWHGRQHSWHDRTRSWHSRNSSWHDRQQSWHGRDRSWHSRDRSWHNRAESRGGDHHRNRSWHSRDRSWHSRAESRGGGDHHRNRSWHSRAESRGGDSGHNRRLSLQDGGHNRKRSLDQSGGGTHHNRRISAQQGGGTTHNRRLSQQQGGTDPSGGGTHHNRKVSAQQQGGGTTHNRRLSQQQGGTDPSGGGTHHNRKLSSQQQGGTQGGGSSHNRRLSSQQQGGTGQSGGGTHHNRKISAQQQGGTQGGGTSHNRRLSSQQQGGTGQSGGGTHHNRRISAQQQGGTQGGGTSHNRRLSSQQQGGTGQSGGGTRHNRSLSSQQQGGGSTHNRAVSSQKQGGTGQSGGGTRHNRSISSQQQGGGSAHNRAVSSQKQGSTGQSGGGAKHDRRISAQQQGTR